MLSRPVSWRPSSTLYDIIRIVLCGGTCLDRRRFSWLQLSIRERTPHSSRVVKRKSNRVLRSTLKCGFSVAGVCLYLARNKPHDATATHTKVICTAITMSMCPMRRLVICGTVKDVTRRCWNKNTIPPSVKEMSQRYERLRVLLAHKKAGTCRTSR